MARIRSIKPEFWSDRKLARLSRDARLLYVALWNLADEHGRLHGDARFIKGHCFPYDDDIDLDDVEALLRELDRLGRMQRYEHDDDPFLFLPTLAKHQRLEAGKQHSRLPAPPCVGPGPEDPPTPTTVRAEKSAQTPDKSADDPNPSGEIVAQQVAGSRWQVAGSRESGQSAGADSPREDVEHLCQYFLTAIQANGCKGRVTDRWRTEARLLLDRDARDPHEIRAVIDWTVGDGFWKANVLSVPKLREKYDQLRLAMGGRDRQLATSDQRVAEGRALVAHFAGQEQS